MSNAVVKIKNVSKYYKLYSSPRDRLKEALSPFGKLYHRKFYALNNISFEIKKGEILGVVGKNGCGKSTLLKLVSGVLSPNKGDVSVNGNISALLELGSGFNPEFSGIQNIFFYGTILGFSRKQMKKKLNAILTFADIGEFIKQPVKTYSSGMKARLSFAVAINVDPEILILDEVLAVGDMLFKRKCYMKMEEFFNSGKTIIYVSHNMNSVNQLCTRAVLLSSGSIVLDGDPKAVTAEYKRRLYNNETVRGNASTGKYLKTNKTLSVEKDFDVSLKTEVIVKEGDSDVEFYDYHILNKKGVRVNVLKCHESYTYVYFVKLKQMLKDVSFGAGIRDKQGVPLTWMIDDNTLKDLEGNCLYKVAWNFTCRLHSGLYYTTAGIRDSHGYLIRQELDTFVFKVEKNQLLNKGGIFDSSWECEMYKETI